MNKPIVVTFFCDGKEPREKEYVGETMALGATLDMDEHIRNGGFCMAEYGGRAVLIETIAQLWWNSDFSPLPL